MKNLNKLFFETKNLSTSERFHNATKNKRLSTINRTIYPESWIKIHFKTYPRLNKIKLLPIKRILRESLIGVINKRRSIRDFTGEDIDFNDFSYLLSGSAGINLLTEVSDYNTSRRSYPSAGVRYPLEIYPLILNCQKIKKGLYHYNVKDNLLELLLEKDLSKWLINAIGKEKWLLKSSVIFIITTVLDRTKVKYGDRGYRYSLIEAGHLAQNLYLLSTEKNLGACAIGGYLDSEFDKLLDINFQKEFTIYLIAVGKL